MMVFMWNCKEMDKKVKGVVKPNQGQKEMEEEEKKLRKKLVGTWDLQGKEKKK